MALTRRQFLKGGVAAAAGLGLAPRMTRIPGTGVSYAAGPGDAVVVFVQMLGGNDGINTVYPLNGAQRTAYETARPTLQLPKTDAAMQPWVDAGFGYGTVNDIGTNTDGARYALHPAMGALRQLYGAGRLAVLPGVHYPFADHSHFRSMAIYWTGDPQGPASQGWFGQYMNAAGFTGTEVPAVALGGGVSPIFVPTQTGIFAFSWLSSLRYPADAELAQRQAAFEQLYGVSAGAVATSFPELVRIGQTGAAGVDKLEDYYKPGGGLANAGRVEALLLDEDGNYNRYNPLVYGSPLNDPKLDDMDLATDLRHVAATIRANVGARFFHVGIGGFDTHTNQEQDFWHSRLLYELSESMAAFHGDMAQSASLPGGYSGYLAGAVASKVVVVVFSEFGRTLNQNSTSPAVAGTDHATSAPMLVLGNPVIGGQYGVYPPLADPADGYNDLRMTHDVRDVFGTVLTRWLNVSPTTLGPGAGKLFPATPSPDDNGDDYTTFTPIGFLAP